MLVQHRPDVLRLITQHDHALVSGALARAWRGLAGTAGAAGTAGDAGVAGPGVTARAGAAAGHALLPIEVILAAALHDASWRELDRAPLLDPESGLPHDFTTYPGELRREATAAGIAEVAALHPYAGRLVALHYERLGIETPADPASPWRPEDAGVRRDVELLRLFDVLSLRLCLTPPGSGPGGHYPWLLDEERFALPEGVLDVRWVDGEVLAVDPFPFLRVPLEIEIPYREIPRAAIDTEEALQEAWRSAPVATARHRLVEGGGARFRPPGGASL